MGAIQVPRKLRKMKKAMVKKVDLNKGIIREFFTAIDKGNLNRVKELLSSDFKLYAPGLSEPWGIPEIIQNIRQFYTAFPDSTHVIDDVIAEGDKVAVRLNQYGTHKMEYEGIPATGKKVKISAMHMVTITDGKIKQWWALEDTLGHMQQLGMELKRATA